MDKTTLKLPDGNIVEAMAPVVVSASRSTDIPAFYARWFIERLKAGYVVWYNPFNNRHTYVSFKNCKVVVFWTKNPLSIIPLLGELDKRGIHYYFQHSMNDYDQERFEPNVPSIEKRIETFKELSSMIGSERIIWRFDPLVITPHLGIDELAKRIERIGEGIKGCTDKLVFSFIDINAYRKVQNNMVKETGIFTKEDIGSWEFSVQQMEAMAMRLAALRDHWAAEGWKIELATCGEAFDLDKYNISHNRCIDAELMKRVFAHDEDLVYYLNYGELRRPTDLSLFAFEDNIRNPLTEKQLKDKGQRKECGCMVAKDIGMYNTCSHFCVYCYANTSKEIVIKNRQKHTIDSESIICR